MRRVGELVKRWRVEGLVKRGRIGGLVKRESVIKERVSKEEEGCRVSK